MSTRTWRPGALAVAQIDTLTVGGTIEAGDLFNVTIGSKTLSHAAVATTTAALATELATALAGLTDALFPEFENITFAPSGSTVTCTADDPGTPFTLTVATTESDGSAADSQTFVRAATTANAGPNNFDGANNWSAATVPVSTDTAVLEDSSVPLLYNLGQSAITLAALHIRASFEAEIGLAEWNPDEYPEYRATYLAIGATLLVIGEGEGNGSDRIKIDTGTPQTTITVRKTGTGEDGNPAFLWKGTHASNAMSALAGSVGIAYFGGEVATLASLLVTEADVVAGTGLTLTTAELGGKGSIELRCACTTLTLNEGAGEVTAVGSGNFTTVKVLGGTFNVRRSCTITNSEIGSNGTLDLSEATGAVTFTNAIQMAKGATLKDPRKLGVYSAGIAPVGCGMDELNVTLGSDRTFTPA
jgi:hypothetical protein